MYEYYIKEAFAETNESFIIKAKKIHGDEYNYSKINYVNQKIKIVITCKKHGDFLQQPSNHLLGKGCLKCGRVESVGERKVKKWLKENNIDFEQEKKFSSLIGKKNSNYRFDFYLPKHNLLIEYDGKQHFMPARNPALRGNPIIKFIQTIHEGTVFFHIDLSR